MLLHDALEVAFLLDRVHIGKTLETGRYREYVLERRDIVVDGIGEADRERFLVAQRLVFQDVLGDIDEMPPHDAHRSQGDQQEPEKKLIGEFAAMRRVHVAVPFPGVSTYLTYEFYRKIKLGLAQKKLSTEVSTASPEGHYQESILQARFTVLSMKEVTELLQEIELNKRVFIKELDIATSKKQANSIDVTLIIATLEPKQQETGESTE